MKLLHTQLRASQPRNPLCYSSFHQLSWTVLLAAQNISQKLLTCWIWCSKNYVTDKIHTLTTASLKNQNSDENFMWLFC